MYSYIREEKLKEFLETKAERVKKHKKIYNYLLDKRKPKFVNMQHIKGYNSCYNDGYCPCCESYISENDENLKLFYCYKCGQRLKWKEF